MVNSVRRVLDRFFNTAGTVVVADVENITRSAFDLGGRLDPSGLAQRLRAHGAGDLWAVLSAHAGTRATETEFGESGWRVHRASCRSPAGTANADLAIASVAALVVARGISTLVLLTGDGELACGIAETMRLTVGGRLRIVIGAFAHSCSRRLDPRINTDIDERFGLENYVAYTTRHRHQGASGMAHHGGLSRDPRWALC